MNAEAIKLNDMVTIQKMAAGGRKARARARAPMTKVEKRAMRSPCSTLSSRKRGRNGRSFRKAETGVSRSAAMS